eukprot:7394578-Pyramimonas_sp.AAC.1
MGGSTMGRSSPTRGRATNRAFVSWAFSSWGAAQGLGAWLAACPTHGRIDDSVAVVADVRHISIAALRAKDLDGQRSSISVGAQ